MIYTVTLNPALDKTLQVPQFTVDRVNRVKALQLDPGGKGINVSKVLHELGQPNKALGFLGGATGSDIARRLAAMVAPTERKVRSINMGDQGKPSLRMARVSSWPLRAAAT